MDMPPRNTAPAATSHEAEAHAQRWVTGQVSSPAGRITWVRSDGGTPTDVYIHGLGGGAADFISAAGDPRLARRGAVLIELLGHGASDRPSEFAYTVEAHAEVVCSALDARAHAGDRFGGALIGHSMGGAVAVLVALMRPRFFTRVVLAEPNLIRGTRGILSGRIAEQTEAEFVAHGMPDVLDRLGPAAAARMSRCDATAIHRSARSLVRGCDPEVYHRLGQVPHDAVILVGDRSQPYPDEELVRSLAIPIIEVPDAGHFMMHDNPRGFVDAVVAALSSA